MERKYTLLFVLVAVLVCATMLLFDLDLVSFVSMRGESEENLERASELIYSHVRKKYGRKSPAVEELLRIAGEPVTWDQVPEKYKLKDNEPGQYFLYQPTGGWGNQRIEVKSAIHISNALGRTLLLPMVDAHSNFYQGYEKNRASDMVSMAQILDLEYIEKDVRHGIKVLNVTLKRLEKQVLNKLKWRHFTKPRYQKNANGVMDKAAGRLIYNFVFMKNVFRPMKEDVIFWDKNSMWMCCAGTARYESSIVFNNHLKAIALALVQPFGRYNAIHVRRNGHGGLDRKTADIYFAKHNLKTFDQTLPLYIATDEKNKKWFDNLLEHHSFETIYFWKDLDHDIINEEVSHYPAKLKNDILGFIEQLICGNAVKWQGSKGSTFSTAIAAIRRDPKLHLLKGVNLDALHEIVHEEDNPPPEAFQTQGIEDDDGELDPHNDWEFQQHGHLDDTHDIIYQLNMTLNWTLTPQQANAYIKQHHLIL